MKKIISISVLASITLASTLTIKIDLGSRDNLKIDNNSIFTTQNNIVQLSNYKNFNKIKKQNLTDNNNYKGALIIYPTTYLNIKNGYIYSPQFSNYFKVNSLYGNIIEDNKEFYSYLLLLDRLQTSKFLFFYDENTNNNYDSYMNQLATLKEKVQTEIKNQNRQKQLIQKLDFLINLLVDSKKIFNNINSKTYTQNIQNLNLKSDTDTDTNSYFYSILNKEKTLYSVKNVSSDNKVSLLYPTLKILDAGNNKISFQGSLIKLISNSDTSISATYNISNIKSSMPSTLNKFQSNYSNTIKSFILDNAKAFKNLNFDNLNFIVSNSIVTRNLNALYRGDANNFINSIELLKLTLQYKYNKYTQNIKDFYPLLDIKDFYKPIKTTTIKDMNKSISINQDSAIANNYVPVNFNVNKIPPVINIKSPEGHILFIKYTPISGDYKIFNVNSVKNLLSNYYGGKFNNIQTNELYVYNLKNGKIDSKVDNLIVDKNTRLTYLINSTPLFGVTCTKGKCSLSQRLYQNSNAFIDFNNKNIKYLYDKIINYAVNKISNLNAKTYQIREIDSLFIDKNVFNEEKFNESFKNPVNLPIDYFTPAKVNTVMQQDTYSVDEYDKVYKMCGDTNTTLFKYKDTTTPKSLDCIYNISPASHPAEVLVDKTYETDTEGQVGAIRNFKTIGISQGIDLNSTFKGDVNFVSSAILNKLDPKTYNSEAPKPICIAMGQEENCTYSSIPLTICPADNFIKAHSIILSDPKRPIYFNKGYAYPQDINNIKTYPKLVNPDIAALYSYNKTLPSAGNYVYDNNNPFYNLFLKSLYKYVFFKNFNVIDGKIVKVYKCGDKYQMNPCQTECEE